MNNNFICYQIYVPSFKDTNDDGFGDLKGIISKLDYIKQLGVNAIWLTPFYQSPRIDNGYDVSDYYQVDKLFGTLDDIKELTNYCTKINLKVIIDIVLNHVSTESIWFKEALSSKDNVYQDYFIFKDNIPNNFESFFLGSAWEYVPTLNKYYYHAFSPEQIDLNHTNPKVYAETINILKYWCDLGVSGFRFDVINFLKVKDVFAINNPVDDKGAQIHLFDQNIDGIRPYLTKLIKDLKTYYPSVITIGEIGSDELDIIAQYDSIFDYTFQFNLGSRLEFKLEHYLSDYQATINLIKVPTIFFSSHDMSRSITRLFNNDSELAKCLASLHCFLNGAMFIFQGEEFGMNDYIAKSIDYMNDIQGRNTYYQSLSQMDPEKAFEKALTKSRDGARALIVFDETDCNKPAWLKDQSSKSLASQIGCEDSLYNHYRKLIQLRNDDYFMLNQDIDIDFIQDDVVELSKNNGKSSVRLTINMSNQVAYGVQPKSYQIYYDNKKLI